MVKILHLQLYIFLILLSTGLSGQHLQKKDNLSWRGVISEEPEPGTHVQYLYFDNASVDPISSLPEYSHHFNILTENVDIETNLNDAHYIPCLPDESLFLESLDFTATDIDIKTDIQYVSKKPIVIASFVPIRLNAESGLYEKLESFNLVVNVSTDPNSTKIKSVKEYAEHSVLQTGDWYKIKVKESGVYKITYDDLQSYGLDPGSVNPKHIRIYGNAGGMLPEKNSLFRHDDLQENAIRVIGEDDGSFDQNDYILFYGMDPFTWTNSLGFFIHNVNYYDDYNYYFITASLGEGKRIQTEEQTTALVTNSIDKYNQYKIYEEENLSLLLSGKRWYSDEFGETNSRTYQFNFPEIRDGEDIVIKTEVANRTYINDHMVIKVNGEYADTVTLTSINVNSTKYAQVKKKTIHYEDLGPEIMVEIEYLQAESASRMWLDYINVNVVSNLKILGGQLVFRELSSIADGSTTEFTIDNAGSQTEVWEVTQPLDPVNMVVSHSGNQTSFIADTDSLREFVTFNGTAYFSPQFVSVVENQDLHGSGPFDYVILTHPLFRPHAELVAQIHDSVDGFDILVVEPETVYNEFSSGKQDPTAIRDLLKLYYDVHEGQEPRFLLLFGDGSVDPKDRIEHNTNFIPTYQTDESWITATSYVVDDYYGLLDDNEGDDAVGILDIGIGRFPVQTPEQAQDMVDKIRTYLTPGEDQMDNWRLKICIIADDEDGNLHFEQAESLANGSGYVPPLYNQNKIYLDAFPQVNTPTGDKYPEVTERIHQQIEEGALMINYIGHGGTGGWAHERILQQNDMLNWKNKTKLPMFITATCEFSRFDEPEIVSGGEIVMLNPDGGGIALFTTTRLAYAQSNFRLNQRIYARAFVPAEGEMPYLGDLIRESKPPGQLTTRNFILLGDPALKLSYPKYNIKTETFNGIIIDEGIYDTVSALQEITITGIIEDKNGMQVNDFNGVIKPVLYDKPTNYITIGNDNNSSPEEFVNQDKILWKGEASVINGSFSFNFVVPRDIAYHFDQAKMSYYARAETEDAGGYFNDFVLGGLDENASNDNTGPEIELFINDTTFINGGLSHDNPILIAYLSDEHGINQSQNGIGHDLTLVMNDDYSNIMVLNDYYKAAIDDFTSGYLEYPFNDLANGTYTLTLKAWDSYNNSSSNSIQFVVDMNSELSLFEVINYPNPFTEETTFSFKHSRPGNSLQIELTIFDLVGNFVHSINTELYSENIAMPFLTWNGNDGKGVRLNPGIYIYTVKVTDELGQVTLQRQKMIMQN